MYKPIVIKKKKKNNFERKGAYMSAFVGSKK